MYVIRREISGRRNKVEESVAILVRREFEKDEKLKKYEKFILLLERIFVKIWTRALKHRYVAHAFMNKISSDAEKC